MEAKTQKDKQIKKIAEIVKNFIISKLLSKGKNGGRKKYHKNVSEERSKGRNFRLILLS